MVDHPLVSAEVRQYMEKHQLESGLNKALNRVLSELPQDPFSTMAVQLIDLNPSNPVFSRLHAKPAFLCDLQHESLQIDVYLAYQGNERCFYSYTYTYNEAEKESLTWDNKEEMQGMKTACQLINDHLSPLLVDRDLYLFKKLELLLLNFKRKKEDQGVTVGPNVISAVSNALFYACAKAMDSQYPYLQMYKANMLKDFQLPFVEAASKGMGASQTPSQDAQSAGRSLPKLLINVFNGGKESGSKVKFSRFYLIIDVNPVELAKMVTEKEEGAEGEGQPPKPINIHEAYIKFSQAVEKAVGATKQGLAAFKRGVDGAFYNAYDNINECFKVIEDAIAATGANTDQKKYLKIGINTDAHSWYLEDANKYEWDGPKV